MRVPRGIAIAGGLLLFVIGIRFLVVPDGAARTFGLARDITGYELHYVIGLRDLWLGALAVALAWLKEWKALALWFAFAALVCFSDATIATQSSGRTAAVAFHVICGLFSVALAAVFWRARRL